MIQKLSSYWLYGTSFCSLELTTQMSKEKVYGITAKKNKDGYDDFAFFEDDDLAKVANHLSKRQHCFLTINTDDVLIEKVTYFEKEEDVIAQAFPNLTSEFYTEILRQGQHAFVAICRKEYVDDKITILEKQGISVVSFALGFTSLPNVISFIDNKGITSTRQEFKVSDDSIASFNQIDTSPNSYSIEEVPVSSNHLLSVAALPFYFKNVSFDNDIEQENLALRDRHKNRVFFQKGLYVGAAFIALIWFINMFFYSSYKNQLRDIRSSSSISETQKTEYQEKLKQVNQKERIVQNIAESSRSKSMFYINRIISLLPETMSLLSLEYQPMEKAIREGKEITYLRNSIVVSGTSLNDLDYNNWISQLESHNWIERITVTNYTQQLNSRIDFELKLTIDDAEN